MHERTDGRWQVRWREDRQGRDIESRAVLHEYRQLLPVDAQTRHLTQYTIQASNPSQMHTNACTCHGCLYYPPDISGWQCCFANAM